jgi:hypothetical protein
MLGANAFGWAYPAQAYAGTTMVAPLSKRPAVPFMGGAGGGGKMN